MNNEYMNILEINGLLFQMGKPEEELERRIPEAIANVWYSQIQRFAIVEGDSGRFYVADDLRKRVNRYIDFTRAVKSIIARTNKEAMKQRIAELEQTVLVLDEELRHRFGWTNSDPLVCELRTVTGSGKCQCSCLALHRLLQAVRS